MDVFCPKCGEPVDNDELHDAAETNDTTYAAIARDFRSRGCATLGMTCSTPRMTTDRVFGLTPQAAAGALYELLGDDMDGAAAMLDDLRF